MDPQPLKIRFKSGPKPIPEDAKHLPKIFCFILSVPDVEGGKAMSISEDGYIFVQRPTLNHDTAQWDTAYRHDPDQEHPALRGYAVAYPDGVQMQWVGDPSNNEGVLSSLDKASQIEDKIGSVMGSSNEKKREFVRDDDGNVSIRLVLESLRDAQEYEQIISL